MNNAHEVLVSARDAETLALVLNDRRHIDPRAADGANELAEVLMEARLVPDERLPADRVAMDSRVTYREEPGGESRTVTLVHPARANVGEGRISVLSPVGRSLLGRRSGEVIVAGIPGVRPIKLRILEAARP